MPVRNKKKLQANRQKLEILQHQKQFVINIKDLIVKAAGPEILRFIPEYELEDLYKVRFHPARVKPAAGEKIPSDIVEFANRLITLQSKNTFLPIEVGSIAQLSLYEYFSTAFTLILYIQRINDDDFTRAAEVKKALTPLAAIFDSPIYDTAARKCHQIMIAGAMFCCDYSEYLYTFKFNPSVMVRGLSKAGLLSEIYKTQLPKIKIQIGEHTRPAWHLGWYMSDPEPFIKHITVRSEDIFQPAGKELNVYIQSHALNRLAERLGGIDIGILHYNIFNSFCLQKVCRNKAGMLLFEYSIFENKAGYFPAEIVDGKVILKTFLFLTHNGTPEADKLKATMGLMKEDINYLDIDKLSTFVLSDIANNEPIKQLFIEAGCESLFQIDREYYLSSEDKPVTSKAELIAKYLQLNTF